MFQIQVGNAKKRLPSGSPEAKNPGSGSDESYDDAVDNMEEEASKSNWRQYQLTNVTVNSIAGPFFNICSFKHVKDRIKH